MRNHLCNAIIFACLAIQFDGEYSKGAHAQYARQRSSHRTEPPSKFTVPKANLDDKKISNKPVDALSGKRSNSETGNEREPSTSIKGICSLA
jgi:hypothetical protein